MIPKPDETELSALLPEMVSLEYRATGGFKVVFRGVTRDGVEEAVKAIYIPEEKEGFEPEQIAQLVARAQREIEALALCTSPVIVKLGRIAPKRVELSTGAYLLYSEEFLSGSPLSDFVGKLHPDLGTLYEVCLFLLAVLEEMTRIEHLHRDIKPANIMVTGIPKRPYVILDMGIAYKMQGTQITQGGGPPGTLRYMAPELFSPMYKDLMDFRCDVYSAGVTLYEYASGMNPFAPQPESPYVTQYRILKEKPQPLESLRPDLPPHFCRIVDRCIKKNPALRYSRLDLLREELEEAVS